MAIQWQSEHITGLQLQLITCSKSFEYVQKVFLILLQCKIAKADVRATSMSVMKCPLPCHLSLIGAQYTRCKPGPGKPAVVLCHALSVPMQLQPQKHACCSGTWSAASVARVGCAMFAMAALA